MLTSFRSHIKGWIAWVFVILVSVPFALWGVSSYRSVITSSYVAKVGGQEISPQDFQNAYQNAYQQRQQTLQGKFNPTPSEEKAFKQQVLNQLITETLLRERAQKYHMVASQADVRAQIRQIPVFQANGKFSYQRYLAVLANNGLTPDQFQARVRKSLKTQILQDGLAGTAFATPRAAENLIGVAKERRKIAWLSLPLAGFMPKNPPSEEKISTYYKSHKSTFTLPESATIRYVRLDQKTLEKDIKADKASLESWYRTHQSNYGTPSARKMAEILVKPKDANAKSQSAARAQAEKLAGEIKNAGDAEKKFASLARKYSDDKVSARNGGSIGYVGRGQLPDILDKALFAIGKAGEIAGPIKTGKGWYLIQLLDKRAGSVKPYAEVEDQVKASYLKEKAKDRYFKLGDELANLAYEHPGSLEPVAKKLNLDIKTVSDVTREKGSGIATKDKIREAAFSDSVLKEHQNSEPVKLGDLDAVVLRVSDTRPSRLEPLANVRTKIVTAIKQDEAKANATAALERAEAAVRSGKTIAQAAKPLGASPHGPATFARAAQTSNLPPTIATAAFAKPPPAPGKTAYGTVSLKNGEPALFVLLGVTPGSVKQLKQPERQAYITQLAQLNASSAMQDYTAWLRSQADVKIIDKNIP
ncbi:MAG: SurA N-terminal domain-containing protein [Gammaproteobacteria bacterium]